MTVPRRPSSTAHVLDLWDEAEVARQLADAALSTQTQALRSAEAPRGPGCYVLFYSGGHPLYRRAGASAVAMYIGAATSVADRLGRHRVSLAPVADLTIDDFLVVALPTRSIGQATYVEYLLAAELRPVWNDFRLRGFGSRAQGSIRSRGQTRSPWDTLHPGRPWATGPYGHDVAELRRVARDKVRGSATLRR